MPFINFPMTKYRLINWKSQESFDDFMNLFYRIIITHVQGVHTCNGSRENGVTVKKIM